MISLRRIFTLSNGISLLRAPLSLFFFIDNNTLRLAVIFGAMLSDCIDGYLARRYQFSSRIGAVLDPLMDKFFVFSALSALLIEKKITTWQISCMLSRDIFLLFFVFYILLFGNWKTCELKAIRFGKVATALQFCVLIAIVLKKSIPHFIYISFVFLGALGFLELIERELRIKKS